MIRKMIIMIKKILKQEKKEIKGLIIDIGFLLVFSLLDKKIDKAFVVLVLVDLIMIIYDIYKNIKKVKDE